MSLSAGDVAYSKSFIYKKKQYQDMQRSLYYWSKKNITACPQKGHQFGVRKKLWKYITYSYQKKKMDALFLGVSHVIPCCVLRFFGRVSIGT